MNKEEEKNGALLEQGPIITTAPPITFDDILQQIGPFGRSQILVYVVTSLFDVLIACQLMFFLFGGGNPGWYCIPSHAANELVVNGSNYYNVSSSSSMGSIPGGFLEVIETRPRGLLTGSVTSTYLVKLEWDGVCSVNGSQCAHVVFKPGSTIVTEFSLTCDMKYASTFCTTMSMVGILFGAGVGGQLADLFGRRIIFFCIAFLMLLTQFGQSFAASWQMFAGFRFCAGFLSGGFMVVTYIIPLEVVGRQWRTVCGCIGFWQIGQMAFAGMAALIPNWRHLSLATSAVCAPLLLAWFVVPESPRWLIQKNRLPEAHAILTRMAKRNGRAPPAEALLKQISKETESNQKCSFLDLFHGRQYTTRTLVMFFIWFSCTMTYYGLSLNARDISDDVNLNILIMGFAELVFVTSVIYSSYRFGRRPALLFYFTFTCCCLVAAMALNVTKKSVMAQSILGSLGRASLAAAWSVAYLLSAELFPTVIRFSCTMTYYGLSLNARDISDDVNLNILIMGFAELVFVTSVIYSSYRFGRRPALLFYFTFTCCCLVAAMALNVTKKSVMAQSILGSLGRASLAAAWSVAYLLSAELFPTVIRAIACGSSSVAGRVGGILAPQIAYMKFIHPVIPSMVYASCAVVALVLAAVFLPETKGTSLPDKLSSKGNCCSSPVLEDEEEEEVVVIQQHDTDPTAV